MNDLENKTCYLLREAYARFENPAVLWSMGKDSTALLALCRMAFVGNVPFPVVHLDTGLKFPEMYEFRDRLAREWRLNLVVYQSRVGDNADVDPKTYSKLDCCTRLKTDALKNVIEECQYDAILLAIRRDEHGIRAKERFFSPRTREFGWDFRNQPMEIWDQFAALAPESGHVRVHPMLHWREIDVWRFTEAREIPVNTLYFSRNGHRYRSLGCLPCTSPVPSEAATVSQIVRELEETRTAERAGRAQDKENAFTMQKLRAMGYM